MWKWQAEGETKATVVIVHGAGEYHARYEWTVAQFRKLGFQVIMGDLPGQGTTEGPRGHVNSFQEYVHTVKKWITEAKKTKEPVILFGHSMGGLIAATTLQELKENELPDMAVLSSPCFGLIKKQPWAKQAAVNVLNRVAPRTMFPNGLEPGSGTRDPVMRARDLKDDLLIKRVSARWYKQLLLAIAKAHNFVQDIPNIPVYIAQGGDDRIVDKNAVKEWFNKLDVDEKYYKEWPDLFHEVLNEPEREEVVAHMAGFITTQLTLKK
ncbi:alpha/beta hydrolase [Alkalicoccus daliensis]|uniref:Lysophospholipase n=1 Tax=Alkalicoccus daliensis TaxID=745820 RepID=A0A1H0H0G8_9BACI|nr:alpha/beta hydrolase [Alkalicoccus daliensis]SDO12667.1 lysophospholipase [Alkalicoccus daliensis]